MSNEKKKWSILDGIELSDPEERMSWRRWVR